MENGLTVESAPRIRIIVESPLRERVMGPDFAIACF
jgi:hypothetical protein